MSMEPNNLYKILLKKYGNLNWWPMDSTYHERMGSDPRFEIIVGAVLTQNTAWSNVEKALFKLKEKNMLEIIKIHNVNEQDLKMMIRSSGFFNQKARRLKELSDYLYFNHDANLDKFFDRDVFDIRNELLTINGIGPETADSILLYAGNKPVFVVDAYTKRLCQRIPIEVKIDYDQIQNYFQKDLSRQFDKKNLSRIYNELHAQIVILAKESCKKKPFCDNCPINKYCEYKKSLF
jgi:endonuclease-3 related protein